MVVRASRRLPGFSFEYQPPPPTDVLPRMDVAAFVGFAESGPLHVPVAVEDATQFTNIFGNDVPLAWDQQRSEQVYAYLAPAVRAFFRNGGRRCWVIRVAYSAEKDAKTDDKGAQYNYFPVPGMALVDADGNITPAFTRARSEGSWSDGLRAGTSLLSHPVFVNLIQPSSKGGLVVDLAVDSPNDIGIGDFLRLTFSEGYVLMLAVNSVEPVNLGAISSLPGAGATLFAPSSPPDGPTSRSTVQVTTRTAVWFTTNPPSSPLPEPTRAVMFTHGAELPPIAVSSYQEMNQSISLHLGVSLAHVRELEPGSLIRVDFGTHQLWLMLQEVNVKHDVESPVGSPPAEIVEVVGQGLWSLKGQPSIWPTSTPRAEKLSLTLWVRQGDDYPTSLRNLAFGTDHPRFWKALPTDEQLYRDAEVTSDPEHSVIWRALSDTPYTALWLEAANPRFPLAGDDATGEVYVPIAMPITPDFFLGLDKRVSKQLDAPLARDGLKDFNANLFLDWDMIESLTPDLMAQADFLRYQSPEPRSLQGIYAALSVEEASLIVVPDANQRGWLPADPGQPLPPQPSKPLRHPEWWHCQADVSYDDAQRVIQSQQGKFHNCDMSIIPPPDLSLLDGPDQFCTFTLGWSTENDPQAYYILEEALSLDWSDAVVIYEGAEWRITLFGRGQGDYYYRVRVVIGDASSDWSTGLPVRVPSARSWRLKTEDEYNRQDLLAVQRALVRMCAARGDMFAVLALPEHYREDDAVAHIATLKAPLGRSISLSSPGDVTGTDIRLIFPLGFGERSAFSYAALYHPWLIVREDNRTNILKRVPPDGTACGIMARRAINRGAWIAPANELLAGIVALTPPISRSNWLRLQSAQLNLMRQEPRGFISLSADTLCDEEDGDLRPINVRRLLILLRRMALRLGATYVFEPNSDAFRRLVQRGFEVMLDEMFIRGAFAGSTPNTSFQVVTNTSLNTPQNVDQGRFIVELRVAPSLPMTFLTIRLVQGSVSGTVTEGR